MEKTVKAISATKEFENGTKVFRNEFGVKIEVLSFEPSNSIESMCWYNPYVDVRVRVYNETLNFSVCFTINKYEAPGEYLPEDWLKMNNKDIWNHLYQNLWKNAEELGIFDAILPLESAVEGAIDEFYMEHESEGLSFDEILAAILEESGWGLLESNLLWDFSILKYECAVPGNNIGDYITGFEVEPVKNNDGSETPVIETESEDDKWIKYVLSSNCEYPSLNEFIDQEYSKYLENPIECKEVVYGSFTICFEPGVNIKVKFRDNEWIPLMENNVKTNDVDDVFEGIDEDDLYEEDWDEDEEEEMNENATQV